MNKNMFWSLVSVEGPMSWVIQSTDVSERARKRPSTCPATCSSRSNTPMSKADEAVSQDDVVVRSVVHSVLVRVIT